METQILAALSLFMREGCIGTDDLNGTVHDKSARQTQDTWHYSFLEEQT